MIHPTAIVSDSAKIGNNVSIGAYSIVEDNVILGDNNIIKSHVTINSGTNIGDGNKFYPFSTIGEQSQDKLDDGCDTYLVIGDNNVFREHCAIHRGTAKEHKVTKIGSDNLIMSHCHVAHDCVLGDNIIMASYSALAGHVRVDNYAIIGGGSLVHQYCSIGAYSMSAIGTVILKDVPAYIMVCGNAARERGMNYEGMRRRGYTSDQISELRQAYRIAYRSSYTVLDALKKLYEFGKTNERIKLFADSIKHSKRGITR